MIIRMMVIKYGNGLVLHGMVLAFGNRLVRVAIKDSDDASEFRMINNVWVSEDCEIVRLEFTGPDCMVHHEGTDFLEAMLTAAAAALPVQRVM